MAVASATVALAGTVNVGATAQAEEARSAVNVISGTIETAEGTPLPGTLVFAELSPSAGYLDRVGGSLIHQLGTATTDVQGAFAISLPDSDKVLAEAQYLNGFVNMQVSAIKYEANDGAYTTYVGAGSVYSQVVSYGSSPTGLALAPVNIGVMTIANAAEGIGGLPETPSNDPQDPEHNNDPTAVRLPSVPAVGAAAALAPWAPDPVPTVSMPGDSFSVTAPPMLPEPPPFLMTPEKNEDDPDDRCKHTANQGTWLVDLLDKEARWQPVGEVHSTPGTKVRYTYGESAMTSLGAAVKAEGGHWKVSGSAMITNDGSFDTEMPIMPNTFARRVNGEFNYVHNRKTYCPEGYNTDRGPTATHMEEIKALGWTGGLDYDTGSLPGDDHDSCEKAIDEMHAMTVLPNRTYTKKSGKSFKYTFGVSAFGVGLNAESINDTNHTMELWSGSGGPWKAWGDLDVPSSSRNHAIYVFPHQ